MEDCTVDALIRAFTIKNVQGIGDLNDLQIQTYFEKSPEKIRDLKKIRNHCLTGQVVWPHREEHYNDEGAPVFRSDKAGYTHLWYCGRWLGKGALPGTDGHCGPKDGLQCWSCKQDPELKSKSGTGACIAIARKNVELCKKNEEIEVLVDNDRCAKLRDKRLNEIVREQDDELKRLKDHNQWLEDKMKKETDHLRTCYDDLEKKYFSSLTTRARLIVSTLQRSKP